MPSIDLELMWWGDWMCFALQCNNLSEWWAHLRGTMVFAPLTWEKRSLYEFKV